MRRHQATVAKLRVEGSGNAARVLFSQPPKPRFLLVAYESSGHRSLYELRDRDDDTKLWAWPLARVVLLTERLRDAAAARLRDAFPGQDDTIERTLIGRKADGRDAAPSMQRVRIVPLPSIGHEHVDRAVRRVMVEVPADCPLRANDVHWAFSGLESMDPTTGVIDPFVLTPTDEHNMIGHYWSKHGARRWRSVTAVALPIETKYRDIERSQLREAPKGASVRAGEESRAVGAFRKAMRHAGVRASAVEVRVQREPFEARGRAAEVFADGTRFPKDRLWHVESAPRGRTKEEHLQSVTDGLGVERAVAYRWRLPSAVVPAILVWSSGSLTSEPSVRGVTPRLTSTEHEERGPRAERLRLHSLCAEPAATESKWLRAIRGRFTVGERGGARARRARRRRR
jgi:CRISPR-associated protein Csb2